MALRPPAAMFKDLRELISWCLDADRPREYLVAALPTTARRGDRAIVTDATAPTWNAALTGGGAVVCKVWWNGSAWRAG